MYMQRTKVSVMWHQTYHFLKVPFQILLNKSDFLYGGKGCIQAEKNEFYKYNFLLVILPSEESSRISDINPECNFMHPGPIDTYRPLPFNLTHRMFKSCPDTSVQETSLFPCHFPHSSMLDHEWFCLLPFNQCHSFITYSYIQKLSLHAYFPQVICRAWESQTY